MSPTSTEDNKRWTCARCGFSLERTQRFFEFDRSQHVQVCRLNADSKIRRAIGVRR